VDERRRRRATSRPDRHRARERRQRDIAGATGGRAGPAGVPRTHPQPHRHGRIADRRDRGVRGGQAGTGSPRFGRRPAGGLGVLAVCSVGPAIVQRASPRCPAGAPAARDGRQATWRMSWGTR